MLHVQLPNRSFLPTSISKQVPLKHSVILWDEVYIGLSSAEACCMLIALDRCHFGQCTILRWTWLCWYSTCSRFWPVLDAEAVLGSSNSVILNFSRYYSILQKKLNLRASHSRSSYSPNLPLIAELAQTCSDCARNGHLGHGSAIYVQHIRADCHGYERLCIAFFIQVILSTGGLRWIGVLHSERENCDSMCHREF